MPCPYDTEKTKEEHERIRDREDDDPDEPPPGFVPTPAPLIPPVPFLGFPERKVVPKKAVEEAEKEITLLSFR